jgi:NADPH:quinone reductase-like Zn-dependent oxidoreductase
MAERATPDGRDRPDTMTSVIQERYGGEPEAVFRLGSRPVPVPQADEVLVRVAGSSVDRGTWHLMAGLPYPIRFAGFGVRRPRFANPGMNLSGTVSAVGAGVTAFGPGDEVFGMGRATLAEFAIASPAQLARKPGSIAHPEAASVPVSGSTALQAVRDHGKVRAGDRVLVYGASGGVGSFAVQLAVAAGATVTAVCSRAKADRVASLGAAGVRPYEDGEPDGPFDVILDTGGNRPLRTLRRLLTEDGRLVLVGGENGGRWLGGADRQLRAQVVSRFVRQSLGTFLASGNGTDLAELAVRVDSGALRPLIDHVYGLSEAAEAVRHLIDGRAVGKVAIAVE